MHNARLWCIYSQTSLLLATDAAEGMAGISDDLPEEELARLWACRERICPPDVERRAAVQLRTFLTDAGQPPPELLEIHAKMEQFTALIERIAERQIGRIAHPKQVLAEVAQMKREAITLLLGQITSEVQLRLCVGPPDRS